MTYDRGTTAGAGADPRQFTWLPDQRTVLTVVGDFAGRTGWVSVLDVDGGRLENRMVEVEYGDEVAEVRTGAAAGRARRAGDRRRGVVLRRVIGFGGRACRDHREWTIAWVAHAR